MEFTPYLIFSLNNSLYGVESFCVQEIFFLPELTPISEAPIDLIGVVNLRGDILPVMDLNLRLGYRSLQYSLTDTIIVLAWQEFRIGVIVNQVHEIQNFTSDDIKTNLSYGRMQPSIKSTFIAGFAKMATDVIMLLNIESLFQYVNQKSLGSSDLSDQAIADNLDSVEKIFGEYPRFCPNASPAEKAIFRDRAENLMRSTESESFAGLIPLAVIGLNGEYFGLDLQIVREFTDVSQVTPIPCCPPHIVGNMNLRGEIVTLVDIRGALNLPLSDLTHSSKTMVVQVNDLVAGVTVDEVFDVMYLQPSEMKSIPAAIHSGSADYLRGTASYRETMMSILDLEKLLLEGDLIIDEEV